MTSVEGTSVENTFAADPANVSSEVPDYSSVPPTGDLFSNATATKPSTGQNMPDPPGIEWDYEQKSGADVNMEAPILAEDMMRAGGLGAMDELDSFLPTAVDATDYEESLIDAMQYEDAQPVVGGEIPRPGVGFVKEQEQHIDNHSQHD